MMSAKKYAAKYRHVKKALNVTHSYETSDSDECDVLNYVAVGRDDQLFHAENAENAVHGTYENNSDSEESVSNYDSDNRDLGT